MAIVVTPPTLTVLPNGQYGVPYGPFAISATGAASMSFIKISGNLFGLVLSSTSPTSAELSGTPDGVGFSSLIIRVTDLSNPANRTDVRYDFTVDCPNITLSPSTLPNGELNVMYSQQLTPSPFFPNAYVFSIVSGSLPPGYTMTTGPFPEGGLIEGISTTPGTYTFVVMTETDFGPVTPALCSGTQEYTIIIPAPAVRRRKKKKGRNIPQILCCDPKSLNDGTCLPKVVPSGFEYVSIGNGCYVLKRK